MLILKKLIFAIPFLFFFTLAYLQIPPLFKNPYFILSFKIDLFLQLAIFLTYLLLGTTCFTVFLTLSNSWKYAISVIAVSSAIPLIFIQPPINFILAIGGFFSLITIFLFLNKELSNYLTFKPTIILKPSIKQLTTLLILTLSISFYLVVDNEIKQNGFKIPKSLIDFSLSFSQGNQDLSGISDTNINQVQIPPEQLQYLKANPQLLKQYGLDPSVLENLNQGQDASLDITRTLVESQINNMIRPYQNFVPLALTIFLFFNLQFGVFLLSLFLSPFIWFIFYLLDKSGFTKYQIEMREVKKLVV